MFAVYSPRQEDLEAAEGEQEWEGQWEGLDKASEGGSTFMQVSGRTTSFQPCHVQRLS